MRFVVRCSAIYMAVSIPKARFERGCITSTFCILNACRSRIYALFSWFRTITCVRSINIGDEGIFCVVVWELE